MILDPLSDAIRPALQLLPENMRSRDAEILLLAIGFQESGFAARTQHEGGPARGLWQFERGGGVRGGLLQPAIQSLAGPVCRARGVFPDAMTVWREMETDDVLAAAFARLLLWTSPRRLPREGEVRYAWEYYLDTWRPGKPHEVRWIPNYDKALDLVGPKP